MGKDAKIRMSENGVAVIKRDGERVKVVRIGKRSIWERLLALLGFE